MFSKFSKIFLTKSPLEKSILNFLFQNRYQSKTVEESGTMDVHIIPALSDNYMYIIVDKKSNDAAVVDPVEPDKVIDFVKSKNLNLKKVLTTHHHWDHAGGNKKIVEMVPNLEVFGGDERIDALTCLVKNNSKYNLGELEIQCLSTPCHTKGHICYKVSFQNEINLFTGDTLFVAGCGKFFEGTAEQMHHALFKVIGLLPDHTKIYCGHEYTLSNLKFAEHIEPNNNDIKEKIKFAKKCMADQRPTVPSTIGEEKCYNPFMRVYETTIQQLFQKEGRSIETMAMLREKKNNFK